MPKTILIVSLAATLAIACVASKGSASTDSPFALSESTQAALADEPEVQAELDTVLQETFGTRRHPRLDRLGDPELTEAAQLFRRRCFRCHGSQGAGDGPMSSRLVPRPRDYTRGIFKFGAVEPPYKPRRIDLLATLVHGLPGSAMPSFRGLSLSELNSLVDFVLFLSIRGEVEARLVVEWLEAERHPRDAVAEVQDEVWRSWIESSEHELDVIAPPEDLDPARWELGRSLFLDPTKGSCFKCHGVDGRGHGTSAFEEDESGMQFSILKDEWGNYIGPRDLTVGTFRAGDRREDVYLRLYCGIPGTPMPGLGASSDAGGEPLLSEDEKWALVDYVLSLSGRGPLAGRSEVK